MKLGKKSQIKIFTAILFILILVPGYLIFVKADFPSGDYESVINGDMVGSKNSYFEVNIYPHTSNAFVEQCQYINIIPSSSTQDYDLLLTYNNEISNPDIWVWKNAQYTYGGIDIRETSYTCQTEHFNYTISPKWAECLEWYSNESRYATLWEGEFNSGDIPSKTIYYNESFWNPTKNIGYKYQWISIKDKFSHATVDGTERYWVKNQQLVQDTNYTIKWCYNTPPNSKGKWGFYGKRSIDTLDYAISSGNYIHIDPWWNASCSVKTNYKIEPVYTDPNQILFIETDTTGANWETNRGQIYVVENDTNTLLSWINETAFNLAKTNISTNISTTAGTEFGIDIYYKCGSVHPRLYNYSDVYLIGNSFEEEVEREATFFDFENTATTIIDTTHFTDLKEGLKSDTPGGGGGGKSVNATKYNGAGGVRLRNVTIEYDFYYDQDGDNCDGDDGNELLDFEFYNGLVVLTPCNYQLSYNPNWGYRDGTGYHVTGVDVLDDGWTKVSSYINDSKYYLYIDDAVSGKVLLNSDTAPALAERIRFYDSRLINTWDKLLMYRDYRGDNPTVTNMGEETDSVNPVVNINFPLNNSELITSYVNFTYNVSDADAGSKVNCSLFINQSEWLIDTSITQIVNQTFNVTNLTDGVYNWSVGCFDGSDWANSTEYNLTITIDSTLPSINITYPLNTTYSENISFINYTFTEENPDSCWYSRDGGIVNSSYVVIGNNFTNVISIAGSNIWTLYCNDTTGNENSTNITFYLNDLWFNSPEPYSNKSFRITEFISTNLDNFTLAGEKYRFLGADSYYLADYATNFTYDDDGNEINNSKEYVLEILNEAKYLNINVIRTWAGMHGGGRGDTTWNQSPYGGHYNLFENDYPGNFNETVFEALDWVIYEASQRDIRLQLVFVNNWDDYGGMNWYVKNSPTTIKTHENITDTDDDKYWAFHDQFYNDTNCMEYFKNYTNYTLNRVNTYSGIAYKDDPTIFAWLLANEPRAKSDPLGTEDLITNWTKNMTSWIKSIDSNHLVGLGIEGWGNPFEGTSFIDNHNGTGVDFTTFALHPDQWEWFALRSEHSTDGDWVDEGTSSNAYIDWWTDSSGYSWNNRYEGSYIPNYNPALERHGYYDWVQQHANWSNTLDMPVLLQEAGYGTGHSHEIKDRFYEQMIHNFYNTGGDGLLFWTLNHDNYYYSTATDGDMDDGYGFYLSDDAFLKNKSQSIIDAINFTKYDNAGGTWINELNDNKYDFIFNLGFASDIVIDNCSLYLNTSNGTWSGFVLDQTNTSEIIHDSAYTFTKQFDEDDDEVYWYIECWNGYNLNSTTGYILLETATPIVSLVYPENNTYNSRSVEFVYNVTNTIDISYCELYIDDVLNKTDTTVTEDINQTFSTVFSLEHKSYNWSVKCTDIDSNVGTSTTYNISIDTTAPIVNNQYPINYENISSSYINFTFNTTDANSDIDSCSLWLEKAGVWELNTSDSTITETVNQTFNLTIEDGNYLWKIECNDTLGNSDNSSIRNITIDTILPVINNQYPSNNTYLYSQYVNFTYNVSNADADTISNCSLYIDGILNSTDTSITQIINQSINVTMSYQSFNWSIGCWDSSHKQTNSTQYNFSIYDNAAPTITLDLPINAEEVVGTAQTLKYTPTDNNLFNCTLKYWLGLDSYRRDQLSPVSGTQISEDLTALDYGNWSWKVECYDRWNNSKTSDIYGFTTVGQIDDPSDPAYVGPGGGGGGGGGEPSDEEQIWCGDKICSPEIGETINTCPVDCSPLLNKDLGEDRRGINLIIIFAVSLLAIYTIYLDPKINKLIKRKWNIFMLKRTKNRFSGSRRRRPKRFRL